MYYQQNNTGWQHYKVKLQGQTLKPIERNPGCIINTSAFSNHRADNDTDGQHSLLTTDPAIIFYRSQ